MIGSSSGSETGSGPGPVVRPAPPRPPRFNRNALTIVAVVMGVLVIAAVVLLSPTRSTGPSGPARPPEVPPVTYLDRRPRPRVVDPAFGDTALTDASPSGLAPIDTAALAERLRIMDAEAGRSPYDQAPYGAYGSTQPNEPVSVRRPPTAAERRRAAYEAALEAPLVGAAPGGRGTMGAAGAGQGIAASAVLGDSDGYGLTMPEGQLMPDGRQAPSAPGSSTGGQLSPDALIADAARATGHTIRTSVEPSPGPFAVQAGTVVPAVLLTEINSELPGECLAQITRDVYDTPTQRTILIPKGAKLLCTYGSRVNAGQSRMLIAWTRVLLPDGRSITLPGLPGTDERGARGVGGKVDRHTRQAFGTAGLLSVVSAGLQLSQPRQGSAFAAPSAGQIAAGAVGQELAQVATQLLQRDLNVQPTIRVPQGTPVNVFLNADLTFPGPYVAGR